MKKFIVLALICVNLALVAVLVFHTGQEPAQAQVRRGPIDYNVITSRISTDWDALWVIDTQQRVLMAFVYDKTKPQRGLVAVMPRDLNKDFVIQPQPR